MKTPDALYERANDGLILSLRVQPGSSCDNFAGMHNHRLKLRLCAKAVDGAANTALCHFLSRFFGVSKSCVTLLQGEKSREKRVLIKGDAAAFAKMIDSMISAGQET
jgi:hypothetical protein